MVDLDVDKTFQTYAYKFPCIALPVSFAACVSSSGDVISNITFRNAHRNGTVLWRGFDKRKDENKASYHQTSNIVSVEVTFNICLWHRIRPAESEKRPMYTELLLGNISYLDQHAGCLGTDVTTLNHSQMTRAISKLTPASPNFRTTPAGDIWSPTYYLTCSMPTYSADLRWNRVSSLEPSGLKAEILLIGHSSLLCYCMTMSLTLGRRKE
ncbi:hypothetical protein AVEN_50527-1 [Araneus ventricosus]|uniref:Uncharacterized protein n=1 Tax=Araneus ventricosus TaxID=182803 RepID=A0A4Y2APV6_ARAVE|nr:hypothetical protein AVEN_50527-1 [Araneus ventricosus]